MRLKRGLVQIYTGDGKGKTTAALGLALRASGAGLKVYILQFIKGRPCSELNAICRIKNVVCEQFGTGSFIKGKPSREDRKAACRGLAKAGRVMKCGKYDMVILDEFNVALAAGLIDIKEAISTIKSKPPRVELVMTGRSCPHVLFDHADLISEVREIKHPYRKGIAARRGIEH